MGIIDSSKTKDNNTQSGNTKELFLSELGSELNRYLKTGVKSEKLLIHEEFMKEQKKNNKSNNNIFNTYSSMYENARNLEKDKKIDEALEIYCEILKNFKPEGTLYYERPAIILEKKKDYDEAIEICRIAIKYFKSKKSNICVDEFNHRLDRLKRKKSKLLNPSKKSSTKSTSKKNKNTSKDMVIPQNNTIEKQNITFPDWYVSLSFGKSISSNYPIAITLAKLAPQYIHDNVEGSEIHQAVYSHKPEEYLQFMKLYEIVSNWKSSIVVINGQVVDRKIIGKINYCYGDKCRSGNSRFCYGASQFTANPFGCHRAQMHDYNDPWYSFGNVDRKGVFRVDKNIIRNEIKQRLEPYKLCPALNIENIFNNINDLPNEINPNKDKNWEYKNYIRDGIEYKGVAPKDFGVVGKIEIDLSEIDGRKQKKRSILSKFLDVFKK